MALGPNFSKKEQLQDAILKVYNPQVKRWFKDLDPPTGDWDPEIESRRGALRVACTHDERDSCIMTNLRCQLFNLIRKREDEIRQNQIPIAGIPLGEIHETRRFKPQVMLYFQEDANDVEVGFSPVTGQIQFRIMGNDDITPTDAQTLANRIKSEFALGGGYVWRKGKGMMTYQEKDKGYDFWVLARSPGDARGLISKVLDLRNDAPDWAKANWKENESPADAYPTLPPTQRIYGANRRLPRRRPVADVRFQYAVLHIWGLPNPICLVDRSGIWPAPIEQV